MGDMIIIDMKIIEFYKDNILERIDVGKINQSFNEDNGDYIKMELRDIETNQILYIFYSNRFLFKYVGGNYYFGDYHFNKTTEEFMEGIKHTNSPHRSLLPVPSGKEFLPVGAFRSDYSIQSYKKQFNIYRDDNDKIYIKPNEIRNKINLQENK